MMRVPVSSLWALIWPLIDFY